VLANGGMLPSPAGGPNENEVSPRRRGVRQGGILLLTGAVLVPILGVLDSFARYPQFLHLLVAIAAIICFIGGPLRMVFAALFEEGAPIRPQVAPRSYTPPSLPARSGMPPHGAVALPPASANPPTGWKPNTAELLRPPSVTESTTRLLDNNETKDR